jgi:hypothetical protein
LDLDRIRLAFCALATTAVIGAAGCGDDDEESSEESASAGPEEVTLVADDAGGEYTFELSETPTAETTSVVFDNQGEEGHFLVYARLNEGYTLEEAVNLEGEKGSADVLIEKGARPGETKTFEITKPIEPGNFVMLCPIPTKDGTPHFELGQLEEFSIE